MLASDANGGVQDHPLKEENGMVETIGQGLETNEGKPEPMDEDVPDLGQAPLPADDIRAVGSFQFRIDNFRDLDGSKVMSPVHKIDNNYWRFLVFPLGNRNRDFLAVYVELADHGNLPNGWHKFAHVAIRLKSSDPACECEKGFFHKYDANNADHGYTTYLALANLLNPENGYLGDDDSITLEAVIHTSKGQSEVWAGRGGSYNSKARTGYVGLKNQGATCYMNSILQTLFFTNKLRKAVYKMPTENDEPIKSVPFALQRVFYQLQTGDEPVGTLELTKSFGWDTMDAFMQHDVQEFSRVLCDNLESKMKGTAVEGTIAELFEGKMKSYIKCIDVDYESSRVESFYDVQLNVKGMGTLAKSFEDYVSVETLDGDNKYHAEQHGMQDAKKGVIFEKMPPVLHLQLKRFDYDMELDNMVKVNDRLEFPDHINLDAYLAEKEDTPADYTLLAVLVHTGDLHGGHYVVYIRPDVRGGGWYKYDDDVVVRVREEEAIEANYGSSEGGRAVSPSGLRLGAPGATPRTRLDRKFSNAYMLVYVRDSAIDDVLCPVADMDIPEHLTQRLVREKEEEERQRQEEEDRRHNVTIKLMTDKALSEYHGLDLVDWDVVPKLKFPKDGNLDELYALVAEYMNVPFDSIRLWHCVKRQNKTVRPASPILNGPLEKDSFERLRLQRMTNLKASLQVFVEQLTPDSPVKWTNQYSMIFCKYYDPEKETTTFIKYMAVPKAIRLVDLFGAIRATPILMESLGQGEYNLVAYEEISHTRADAVEADKQLALLEIGTGDILVFQVLVPDAVKHRFLRPTFKQYVTYLKDSVLVTFRLHPECDGMEDMPKEVSLQLSRRHMYSVVAKKLGEAINWHHDNIRMYSPNPSFPDRVGPGIQRYKYQVNENEESTSLADMLHQTNLPTANLIYFQPLNMSVEEAENKVEMPLIFRDHEGKEVELRIWVDKNSTVKDFVEAASAHEAVKLANDEKFTGKWRLLDISYHELNGDLSGDESLPYNKVLRLEEIPADQWKADNANEIVIKVQHFHKEPVYPKFHSSPFYFVIRRGERLVDTRQRLADVMRVKLGDITKWKIAIVGGGPVRYFENDDDIIFDEWDNSRSSTCFLGIDRPGRPANKANVDKGIQIRN